MGGIYDRVRGLFLLPITARASSALCPLDKHFQIKAESCQLPVRMPALSKRSAPPCTRARPSKEFEGARAQLMLWLVVNGEGPRHESLRGNVTELEEEMEKKAVRL